jgi:hypothetical protein
LLVRISKNKFQVARKIVLAFEEEKKLVWFTTKECDRWYLDSYWNVGELQLPDKHGAGLDQGQPGVVKKLVLLLMWLVFSFSCFCM